MRNYILDIYRQATETKERFIKTNLVALEQTIGAVANVLRRGNTILLFGNGGSAADAQHIAAEFVNRFMIDRPPLPAIALTTDSSVLTSIANDFSYSQIFEKQIAALGKKGDAANRNKHFKQSQNVIKGLEKARQMELVTIGIGGPAISPMKENCDYYWQSRGGPPHGYKKCIS